MNLVIAEQFGAVRRLTLNRPEQRNALSRQLLGDLTESLQAAADDASTSAVVLRGAGNGFSAGAELGAESKNVGIWADRERLRRTYHHLEDVFACPLPTVAAVHGFALAGGADLALHCDFLIAADDALIGHPAVRSLGVPPTQMWLYRLGPQLAKRMLLTGDRISGTEAARIGLAVHSCPSVDLDEIAMAFAQRIALIGRELLMSNKAILNRGLDLMGRATLGRFAEHEDAVGHLSPSMAQFAASVRDHGIREAIRRRDAPFDPEPQQISGPVSGGAHD